MREVTSSLGVVLLAAFLGAGCHRSRKPEEKRGSVPSATVAPSASLAVPAEAAPAPATLTGSALARSPDGARLYVADEDRHALRVVAVPWGGVTASVELPGAPAQVVALADRVLITIRHPGLLWIGKPDAGSVVEVARVALPDDAWGVSVSPDQRAALVSSAWTSQLSLVELPAARLRWSLALGREPRGIAIAGGSAYVTHLVGAEISRVDDWNGTPKLTRLALPPAPLRTPPGKTLAASLGYAAALSADQERLFVARHALGALGKNAWFGAATVDVLLTHGDEPLAPRRGEHLRSERSELAQQLISGGDTDVPGSSLTPFTQPRALLVRGATQTLLVAGEGDDRVAELDALALDPTQAVVRHYAIGSEYNQRIHVARHGAAPAGMVLSSDESTLWVYCRASNELAEVRLLAPDAATPDAPAAPKYLELAPDPLGPGGSTGRKLFYSATDHLTSGGLACSGCHPEGRDDGYTWHEATFNTDDGDNANFVGAPENAPPDAHVRGVPRRTPMLAGRVRADGPYGWHAESPSLIDRELKGFGLHRWGGIPEHDAAALGLRAGALADFLRRGLVAPARPDAAQGELEQRGREIFMSKQTRCSECHLPATEYTTRQAFSLSPLPARAEFDEEANDRFKIPSLYFLAGRAPYFHDGSAATLEQLVDENAERMGNTRALSAPDRAALVAFLRTL